jgi:TRAP-type transport system periplasmic protein
MRVIFLVGLFLSLPLAAAEHEIKMATLAPEGSTWWRVFKEADTRLKQLTNGRVELKVYGGGVAGDEPVVVRKMRLGQLHAAAMTSVGMAEIQPALLALQAPGLFQSWQELDKVRSRLSDPLKALLAEKGFVVLSWGDVGFNRLFSNIKVQKPQDLKSLKPWCWTQDGVYRTYYTQAGVHPVMVGVPEVLPGLQTGLLDSFSSPPLVAVAMQWMHKAKYMLDVPLNVTIGAVILKKSAIDKLSPQDQQALHQVSNEIGQKLARAVREDNDTAVQAIQKSGMQIVSVDPTTKALWQNLGEEAADKAAKDGVYPMSLLQDIRRVIKEVRVADAR